MGSARFSTHSHPVGLAFGLRCDLLVPVRLDFVPALILRLSGVFAGVSIGMVFQFVELGVNFRFRRRESEEISWLISAFRSRQPLRLMADAFGPRCFVAGRSTRWALSELRFTPSDIPAFRRARLQRSSHISRIRSTSTGPIFRSSRARIFAFEKLPSQSTARVAMKICPWILRRSPFVFGWCRLTQSAAP